MIKVKADVLKDFLIKTTANAVITDAKLIFGKDGLFMDHKDEPGVICICGMLDKKVFSEYEEMELGVNNTGKLIQALKTFKDNMINIVKEGNMVRFQDENGGIDIALAESVVCYRGAGVPGLEYDNTILVKKSMVLDIIEKSKIVDSEEVVVENKNKTLFFKIGKESDLAESKAMSGCESEKHTSFDLDYFKKLTASMDPIFDLSIGLDGTPSKFVERNDKYNIVYFLTPQSIVQEAKEKAEYEKNKKLAEEAAAKED